MKRITGILIALLCVVILSAQGTLAPVAKFTAFDNNGVIVPAGKLCTYAAGTTTQQATYNDADLAVGHQNTNPVIMDSAGRATVYLSATSYKFTLLTAGTDQTCNTGSQLWSQDNIAAVPTVAGNVDVPGTAGENILAGQAVYLSDGSGGKQNGQWFKADSANTYSSITNPIGISPNAITAAALGTVRLQGQVTGLSVAQGSTYYVGTAGALTTTQPTNPHVLGKADSTTSLILSGPSFSLVPLPLVLGGTGVVSLTTGNVLLGAGVGPIATVAPSTSGNVLTSNGTTWTSAVPTGGYKIGNFTRDLSVVSGTQAVTGVGFTPRFVIFTSNLGGGVIWSVGFDNNSSTVMTIGDNSGGSLPSVTAASIAVGVDSSNFQSGKLSAFGGDGFTITWTKVGTPTGTATMGFYAFQ